MTTTAIVSIPQLRPFTVIGYSTGDEVLCLSCLPRTTPITGEKLSHICRRGPRPVEDRIRKEVLALDGKHIGPYKIAKHLRIELKTVMRVLSGDDADAGTCPACEAAKRSDNRELVPLYFADKSVREETCTYCQHKLVDLAVQRTTERTESYQVEHTTYGKYPALHFDRRPPEHILQAVKKAGWAARRTDAGWLWVDFTGTAEVPSSVRIAPKPVPVTVTARPPIIRRRREAAEAATLH
jgi:hypothetical protein